ncbi:MAG: HEAT repeat domain-containing protein [Planctomycetota bacterium]|jgi:HEAT repeat protein
MSGTTKITVAAFALAAVMGAARAAEPAEGDIQKNIAVLENIKSNRSTREQVVAAIEALGGSGSARAVPPLVEVLKRHTSPHNYRPYGIAAVQALGELGSSAAPAVPFLLSNSFFYERGGRTAREHPLRLATVDALVKIGEPAVPEVIKLLNVKPGGKSNDKVNRSDKFGWKWWAAEILRRMSQTETVGAVLPALEKEMRSAKQRSSYYPVLALMGPRAVPILKRAAQGIAAKGVRSKADANNIRRLGGLIGPEIGNALDAVIPEHYDEKTWDDDRYWIYYRGGWYPLAHARPDPKHIPAFLDLIGDDTMMRTRQYEGVRYTGMILGTMGEAPALPLAALLDDKTLETRWAAAFILTMVGPDGKAALPALEKALANNGEDVQVRVAAARAIAEIKGTDAAALYNRIPDVHSRLVAAARKRSKIAQSHEQWQTHFATDPTQVRVRQLALYSRTPEAEKPMYCLAVNKDLKASNQWVRGYAAKLLEGESKAESFGGGRMSEDLNVFLYLFGTHSRHYPGRLEADVEEAAKEYMFRRVDVPRAEHKGKPRYVPKSASDLDKVLALDDSICIVEATNGPLRSDAQHHLILQSLNSDPRYRNRRFKTGDTVAQRYERFTRFFRRGLKEWALHGMWVELGSSNYEYKTYRGLFLLLDFATDPVVAARARMLMDLALIEIEQISLSGLRGGSKSRAKDGGLDSRFNKTLARLYGEHHGYALEPPGFKGYEPPVPAILLRRLGPTQKVYEIVNRHPGETVDVPQQMTQGSGFHKALSRSINYAYRTPDYITGCSMFDVRLWRGEGKSRKFGYGPLGRWSGVIFRDGSAVYLEAYTGEKWNVQSTDVMIARRYKNSYYKGDARVDLVGSLSLVEKDSWIFADNGDAYAAVRIVKGGYYWNEPDRHRLHLNDQYSPILIQTGRGAIYGSFEKFQQAILEAPYELTEEKLDYAGPNSARIEFFLADDPYILPKTDGETLDLDLKYNYRSPFMEGEVGSDIVTVRYGSPSLASSPHLGAFLGGEAYYTLLRVGKTSPGPPP